MFRCMRGGVRAAARRGAASGAAPETAAFAWETPGAWRGVCPRLTIAGDAAGDDVVGRSTPSVDPGVLPTPRAADLRQRMCEEGVFQILVGELAGYAGVGPASPEETAPSLYASDIAALQASAAGLLAAGWPASFLLVYDEAWRVVSTLSDVLWETTSTAYNMDFIVVCINSGTAFDWKDGLPHRDRPGDTVAGGFFDDGCSKNITAWVPLTDATLATGCLYCLPAPHDANYGAAGEGGEQFGLPAVEAIRALPCAAGSVVCMSHRLLHWRSRPGRFGDHAAPRLALSLGTADGSYEEAYLREPFTPGGAPPPLPVRVALVAAQQLRYHHRLAAPLPPTRAAQYMKMFAPHKRAFSAGYVASVYTIFASQYLGGHVELVEEYYGGGG